jgi:shikimate dehydrogenase
MGYILLSGSKISVRPYPVKTRLIQEAERIGCMTIDGVSMFVYQGAFQFELWTGKKAPVEVMKKAVLNALGRDDHI